MAKTGDVIKGWKFQDGWGPGITRIDGGEADKDGDHLEIDRDEDFMVTVDCNDHGDHHVWVPLDVLAGLMRTAGWTVEPPKKAGA